MKNLFTNSRTRWLGMVICTMFLLLGNAHAWALNSTFTKGEVLFIYTDNGDAAWTSSSCVKLWFNNSGSNVTDGVLTIKDNWLSDYDGNHKLFYAIVPCTGANSVQLQRFASDCSSWWNACGDAAQSGRSSDAYNTFHNTGSNTSTFGWKNETYEMYLYGDPNSWASSLGTLVHKGSGVFSYTLRYKTSATSLDFKMQDSKGKWHGSNVTLSGLTSGKTYDITGTVTLSSGITSLAMSKSVVSFPVTFAPRGTYGTSTVTAKIGASSLTSGTSYESGQEVVFTANPASGYAVEGWYSDASCTESLGNGRNLTYTVSSLDASRSVYVKFAAVKDISVYIYVGDCTDDQKNNLVLTGTPYVGSVALTGVNINSAGFTTEGNWKKYTFNNVSKVHNLHVAGLAGAIPLANIEDATENFYYRMYTGTVLADKCIPAPSLAWTTVPANGIVGGANMTAVVNTSAVSGGSPSITWSTSNSSIANVNSSTGEISYEAAGSATITASVSWSANGDYCAGSYELSQAITVTSGATVSATRACPEYVSTNSGQVKLDISSTGASTGWYYRVCNSTKTAYYAPDEQSAASNTLSWTMNGSLPTGSNTLVVELYNSARQLVCTSSSVTVNVEIAESVTIAAGANGYVTPSGTVYANNNHVHPTITATPADEHYHFENWTSHDPQASVADANSATTTVTATASGYTITANFAGDQYRITYKDQSDVTYSGNNEGSLPATHTYGTATTLINGTKDGFTFGGWYTDVACTVSAGSSIGSTAKTSDFTLYAKWTEVMSTLSTSNSYSVGDPSFAAPTSSVSSIGISTTATVTAHANELGYALTGWTITGGTRTDGGAPNANPITVRSNGDGAAVSVTANYVGSNTPVNIFLPNTGNNWNTSDENWKFYKLPGEAGNTVTLAVNINKYDYSSSNYKLGFNIYHDGWTNKWWHNKSDGDSNMDAHSCTNWGFNTSEGAYRTYLDLNVSGTYTFTLTNSDNSGTQKLSVTYPDKSFIEGAFPTAWSEDAYTLTEDGDIQSVTINITSTGDKEFRLVSHGKLFGTSTKITAAANSQTLSAKNMADGGAVMTLAAYVTGEYTFTYNKSTKQLTVTFPIYNQVRISAASPEDETNVGNFNLSEPTENVRTVTRSLNANTTYTFKVLYESEWYGFDSGTFTRNSSTSSNSRTLTTSGGNMTLTTDYAGSYTFRFNQSTKNLSVDFPTAYTVTYGVGAEYSSMGNVTHNLSISSGDYVLNGTSMTFTATPNPGYKFVGWYSDDACTSSLSTDNPYTFSVTAEKTVYAKFELMDIKINSDVDGVWPVDWVQYIMSHSSGSPAVYTYSTTLTTRVTEQDEAPFNSGYHFNFLASNNDELYNFNNVQEPTYSGSSIDGVRKTADVNPTIQFGLTRKSDVTITLTLKTPPTKPTIHIAADPYYDIAYTAPSHGSYTIKVGDAEAVSDNTDARATTTITLANTPATGYHFGSWTVAKSASNVEVSNNQFTMPAENVTVSTSFTPNTYQVHFHRNGGAGVTVYQDFTYDAAQNLTANTYTKTGYSFAGWALSTDGAVTYADEASVSNLTAEGTYHLYAKWTPNPYTVVLDKQTSAEGYGSEGTVEDQTVTFNATPATVSGTMPSAANGYAFMGFFSAEDGEGRQFINPSGEWVANAGDTISGGNWVKPAGITLYAYYKKAEITGIALGSGTVLPEGSVTATATIEPTPTPTTIICWKLLYNNGTEYSPQPTFTPVSGSEVSFNAPEASGTYKVQAQLRTGGVCGSGTLLSENETSFIVAGTHNVTIQYKCDGVNVKAATVVEGVKPLEWSKEITPGEAPFGYTFTRWEAGDGVSITDDNGVSTKTTTTSSSIKIKAIYDGHLTAVYTQKQMIYFKNTLGWSDVYVNFYTASDWDNTGNGSGSPKGAGNKNVTNRNKHMTQIDDTDIWYFDYGYNEGGSSISPSLYVSFTSASQGNVDEFWAANPGIGVVYPANYADAISTDKSSENGFKAATPMFVPISQEPVEINVGGNGKANYYNRGYWTKYTAGTGYTLEIYNSDGSSHIKSIEFTSADDLMPMEAVADLEAGKTYKFQLRRGGTSAAGIYYGNTGTMTYASHGVGTGWEMTNTMDGGFKMAGITTTAAGDYTFHLTYSANGSGEYRLRMEVDYPIADGDYRVIYKDNVHTAFKPSAIVTKAANHKDTVSFFIRPKSSPVMKIQQSSVTNEGAITWTDHVTITSEITDARCPKDSVYNICLTMNESGEISVENIEGYDGYFYIRTDAANSKWDNYRAADHQMTYSEYAEKKTGSDYTHYWMAHVYANANVKFVIANDYSPCISDTLIRQTARGGDASHVNVSGDILAEANIRYMWDMRNNAVMRAYLAPAQTDGSKFLVLQGQDTKLLAPNGDALTGDSEANPGNNHGGGANAIQFTDKENWMYDAEVQAVPGGRVKLYAVFHGSTFYYYGDDVDSFDGSHAIDLIGGSSGDAQNIRVVYDFKTDRLIAAWVPSDGDISIKQTINADIMLIREHQNAGKQINLTGTGSISTDKTVYGVMRFNRWTLNNKSTAAGHAVLPVGEQKSQYERFNYMISFPFDVKVGEIFGFGTIGRHYRIYYYDGLGRAKEGFFAERGDDNWRMIDDTDSILHANQGYLLQLNYIRMADDNTATWPQANMNEVELYFPAMNEINTIQLENVEIPALGDAYKCKINLQPTYHALNNPDSAEADRRIKDSYWRCIGVPGFTSYEANAGTWVNFNWKAETDSLPYLYEWQMDDNKLSVVSSSTFTFKPMHAYLIQNGKSFTWTSVAHPTVAAPRRSAAEEGFYEFYLEMQNGEQALDHTYVRLTDKENITADFDFGQDLSKELNSGANIFTKVGYERLAANNLPLSEQTTIVPVGVKIAEEGNYTFAMPEGTHGIGVTLVDNETGDRTNLSLFDYSVNLTKGDYDNRFILEISPIVQSPTGIELLNGENGENGVRKVLIDNILYIVKDGIVYDARGNRVQ